MTLLGKIFRPWDLASSSETFVSSSNDDEPKATCSIENEQESRRSSAIASRETQTVSERKSSDLRSNRTDIESRHQKNHKSNYVRNQLRLPASVEDVSEEDDSSKGANGDTTVAHFLELNYASVHHPFYIPSSPVGTPTTPNLLNASAINELASLGRSELTAMGLLPPEPPASMKVKRQRPKRFRCPHCQVAFSNNGQLRGHIRIHTGERPFACEHEGCGKSFTRNEELTRHRRIHTGLRPYPCTHCGKRFGRKDHLKKHSRTHNRPMYNASSGMIGLGNPFHPFNPSLIPSHSAINEFSSTASPYALPFMVGIPPPISHFPFS